MCIWPWRYNTINETTLHVVFEICFVLMKCKQQIIMITNSKTAMKKVWLADYLKMKFEKSIRIHHRCEATDSCAIHFNLSFFFSSISCFIGTRTFCLVKFHIITWIAAFFSNETDCWSFRDILQLSKNICKLFEARQSIKTFSDEWIGKLFNIFSISFAGSKFNHTALF